ncbi:MAG TPA: hypothetical protein VKY74_18495 [Chloroflexia bacterium]|nr:hypothetical protein [Chloroflexia bacterium]
MDTPPLPPTLLAAWRELTPRHQALVLTMMQALAAEDRGGAPEPDPAIPDAPAPATAPADLATMIRQLAMQGPPPAPDPLAWLRSVGMFDGDPSMDGIWEAGRRIREAERAESC